MFQQIAINPKNFHTVAKDAFYEALANNGLAKSEILGPETTLQWMLKYCNKPVLNGTDPNTESSYFQRIMGVFPEKIKELHSAEPSETQTLSLIEHLNQIEHSLEEKLDNVTDDYIHDYSLSRSSEILRELGVKRTIFTQAITYVALEAELKQLAKICGKWQGGLVNAFKTYFGLAKVTFQKLQEATTSLNPDTIKEAIKNNRGLLGQMTKLPLILFRLLDKMNGVRMNTKEPYPYDSNNFQLEPGHKLEITDNFAEQFLEKAVDVTNTTIQAIGGSEERTLLEEIKKNNTRGEGCYAWEAGLMERFFELMDSITCRVVDLHFRDFTSQT